MKSADYNYGYVFLFYDVGEKRVGKVFKVCKKYLNHHQKSVFRGNITPSKLISLKNELNDIILPNEDFVSIIQMQGGYNFTEATLGIGRKDIEDGFL